MAAVEPSNDKTLKGNKIHVDVEEALEDLFVVSYSYGNKLYQGVLLDSTKMNMPHGIVPPICNFRSPTSTETCTGENSNIADKKPQTFFSLRQRFTYFQQPNNENANILQIGGNNIHVVPKRKRTLNKDNKPARVMRLRPRQVLCSKCKSICNENSENVESVAKTASGQNNQSISRSDFGVNTSPRLTLAERINSNIKQAKIEPEVNIIKNSPLHQTLATSPRSLDRCDGTGPRLVEKMILRKRKAEQVIDDKGDCNNPVVAEEWTKKIPNCDSPSRTPFSEKISKANFPTESALPAPKLMVSRNEISDTFEAKMINKSQEEQKKPENKDDSEPSECKYPVIKISFANPKGEGTVMKIPRTGNIVPPSPVHSDDQGIFRLANRPNFSPNPHKDDASAKAAKKALKKAKKEAQRKARIAYGASTPDTVIARTPTGSPHHRVRTKHHKHKLKHKRKHRNGEKWVHHDQLADDSDEPFEETCKFDNVVQQEECLKQRLSISLKRLNKGSYCAAPRDEDINQDYDPNSEVFLPESKPKSFPSETSSSSNSDNSTDCPPEGMSDSEQLNKVKPLMMRITTHNVNKTYLNGGRIMSVGDVVWGKIQGFPWWPGKVLAITVSQRDNGAQITQQAHVTWYGSSTSSYMLCHRLLPFLEEFEHRYNKKKRGPYREAIRQATQEAKHLDLERLNLKLVNKHSDVTEESPL